MTSSNANPQAVARWRAFVPGSLQSPPAFAVLLLTLSIVAGLLAVQCGNRPATPTGARSAPQLCVRGATPPLDRFALVHGCITYSDGSEIWAVDPNHPSNRISLGPSHGLTPIAWSRDGIRLLLMERGNAGTAGIKQDLYVMNADGSQTRLTTDGLSGEGSFSPDGAKVVFSRSDLSLYVVDVKGGAPRLIARSYMAWWLGSPAWSPDGSRIAYTVYLEGGPEGLTYQIWTVNPDGTDPRRLLDLGECGGGGCTGSLAWSPDGSRLAFHSHRGNPAHTTAIYLVHADGSGLRRITDERESSLWPAWSPDGSRIAFVRFDIGSLEPGQLYTAAPDGSDVRQVQGVVFAPPFYGPAWSWNPVVRASR